MLVKHDNVMTNFSLLESIPYLDNFRYDKAMIPVVENVRLNTNIIEVSDIVRYINESNIPYESFDDIVIDIAESNNVDPESISLSVTPIDIACYNNLLENSIFYIIGNYSVLKENTDASEDSIPSEQDVAKLQNYIQNAMSNGQNGITAQALGAKLKSTAKNVLTLKKLRIFLSNNLRKLKNWMQKIEDNFNKTDPAKRGILSKIKVKLAAAIKWVSDKLENLVRTNTYHDIGIDEKTGKITSVALKNNGDNVFTRDGGKVESGLNTIIRSQYPEHKQDFFRHRIDMSK